ncbi:MAG: phosphodiester glycosidase family protein [Actinomycetota bacterium]|nr:phosphodiester glycosidase family protein [Actinomycetota bacterium]
MLGLRSALVAATLLAATAPAAVAYRELPLGPGHLQETRSSRWIAPGVVHTRIVRGSVDPHDAWTVDVAVAATRREARTIARRLRELGYGARIERIGPRAQDDPQHGPLGFRVRAGRFTAQADADALRAGLLADGFAAPRTVYEGEDGERTTGPWVVNVLDVAPGLAAPELATRVVPGREPLTALASRSASPATINGGYFVIGAANGTDGDLAGIYAQDGELVSEAVNGRTSLLLPAHGPARVAALRTLLRVRASDGGERELDGLNRAPGLIRGCGGTGGDVPTEQPKHDFTCTDPGEIIRFDAVFGTATEPGPGIEAVLDGRGDVVELREPRGGPIPPDGSVLAGTGDGADWLRAHAVFAARITTHEFVEGEHGPLGRGQRGIVNGGPRLLRGGAVDIPAYAEGFHYPEDPGFLYRFGLRRNPRTLAGVRRDGRLLLITIDGRAPGHSVGASFAESAAVLRALGARDGVNLDGGGSTAMTIGPTLVTRPSDATGERPIGDAIIVRGG